MPRIYPDTKPVSITVHNKIRGGCPPRMEERLVQSGDAKYLTRMRSKQCARTHIIMFFSFTCLYTHVNLKIFFPAPGPTHTHTRVSTEPPKFNKDTRRTVPNWKTRRPILFKRNMGRRCTVQHNPAKRVVYKTLLK